MSSRPRRDRSTSPRRKSHDRDPSPHRRRDARSHSPHSRSSRPRYDSRSETTPSTGSRSDHVDPSHRPRHHSGERHRHDSIGSHSRTSDRFRNESSSSMTRSPGFHENLAFETNEPQNTKPQKPRQSSKPDRSESPKPKLSKLDRSESPKPKPSKLDRSDSPKPKFASKLERSESPKPKWSNRDYDNNSPPSYYVNEAFSPGPQSPPNGPQNKREWNNGGGPIATISHEAVTVDLTPLPVTDSYSKATATSNNLINDRAYERSYVKPEVHFNDSRTTTIIVEQSPNYSHKPKDFVVTSCAVILCCNFILGIFGYKYAVKANHAWELGDVDQSRKHASKAKLFLIIGLVVGIVTYGAIIGLVTTCCSPFG